MARIEILLEERSMKEVLEVLLPKILPTEWVLNGNYFLRPHEGKGDLKKSIPNKVKVFSNWHEPAGIIILQDQDSSDCRSLKNELSELCKSNGSCKHLIRIVCRELEAWYLADMEAIQKAYPKFQKDKYENKSLFRNPEICNASNELAKILPEFQKVGSAKAIAPYLMVGNSKAESFRQFVTGTIKFFEQFSKK